MVSYLNTIMDTLDFAAEDRAYFQKLYEKIQQVCPDRWQQLLDVYTNDYHCDYAALRAQARELGPALGYQGHSVEFLLFLCMTRHLRTLYEQHNISQRIFVDSCSDLKWKLQECKKILGFPGTFVGHWYPGFFDMTRFALGRLQFEIKGFRVDYAKDGRILNQGDPVLNVHIPATGTPMDRESYMASFAQAAEFFAQPLAGHPIAFVCSSWLLYPPAQNFLPAGSNLRWFYDRFEILTWKHHEGKHPDLWRFFDRHYTGNPDDLPYDNSLRRAYVDHLRQGGKTGTGYGVFFWNE